MRTTIELPTKTFEQAKRLAQAQGISIEQLLAKTIEENLGDRSQFGADLTPPWMKGFGALSDLKEENARILKIIEEEFEQIEPEDQQ